MKYFFLILTTFICLNLNTIKGQTSSNIDAKTVGSIEGTFDASSTGAATYFIPIDAPLGVGGLQPSIGIVYNSQSGNGVAGW